MGAPGKNASVSVTSGLLRKAMKDEKIGKWLERIMKKKEELKAEEKKQEEERVEARKQEAATYKMELKGTDLADLTRQFTMNLADQMALPSSGTFDVRG